jgi:hypothetical protein
MSEAKYAVAKPAGMIDKDAWPGSTHGAKNQVAWQPQWNVADDAGLVIDDGCFVALCGIHIRAMVSQQDCHSKIGELANLAMAGPQPLACPLQLHRMSSGNFDGLDSHLPYLTSFC